MIITYSHNASESNCWYQSQTSPSWQIRFVDDSLTFSRLHGCAGDGLTSASWRHFWCWRPDSGLGPPRRFRRDSVRFCRFSLPILLDPGRDDHCDGLSWHPRTGQHGKCILSSTLVQLCSNRCQGCSMRTSYWCATTSMTIFLEHVIFLYFLIFLVIHVEENWRVSWEFRPMRGLAGSRDGETKNRDWFSQKRLTVVKLCPCCFFCSFKTFQTVCTGFL